MKRNYRRLYKIDVMDRVVPGTMLEKLKQDYVKAKKIHSKRLVYRVPGKQLGKLRSRQSRKEYLNRLKVKEKAELEQERIQLQEEMEELQNELSNI